jgi:hypothetical protein
MKHHLIAALVSVIGLSSCYDTSDGYYGPPPGSSDGRPRCERFTSCATCTPVLGCGWCQSGDKGMCTSAPNHCADAVTFSWTWELAYCPAEPDAGTAGWSSVPPNPSPDGGAPQAEAGASTPGDSGVGPSDASDVDAPHE